MTHDDIAHGSGASLLDLLWEPDDESGSELGSPPEGDLSCRAAAQELQRRQSDHEAFDNSADWSDVGVDLPGARAARSRLHDRYARPVAKQERSRIAGSGSGTLGDAPARRGTALLRTGWSTTPAPGSKGGSTDDDHASGTGTDGKAAVTRRSRKETTVRLLQLLASPEMQHRLAARLPGTPMQLQFVRLWFDQYRPVECEIMFGSPAAASLRALSGRMRSLLLRRGLWSLPVGDLLADNEWDALVRSAGSALAAVREASERP